VVLLLFTLAMGFHRATAPLGRQNGIWSAVVGAEQPRGRRWSAR